MLIFAPCEVVTKTMPGNSGGEMDRWLGVGHEDDRDPVVATRTALATATNGRVPSVVLTFVALSYDLTAVVETLQGDLPPGTPVAGCTTAGELSGGGPTTEGIVIIALGGEGIQASIAIGYDASKDQRGAGEAAAACVEGLDRPHRALLLLTPGFVSHQEEIVRGAYGVTGASVPIVGGAAGDGLLLTGSRQIALGQVLNDAVVGVGIGSTGPIAVAMRHGWRKIGEPMVVTSSDGARVSELDDQPALDVYLDRLGAPPETYHEALALNRFALLHPFGLQRANGEDIRVPGEADFETRTLVCVADLPRGALVWLMEADETSVLESASAACSEALRLLGDRSALGAVVFDCVGRRMILGEGLNKEVAAIEASLGDVPFAGFFTYGEIARVRGSSGVHNETFVVMALA